MDSLNSTHESNLFLLKKQIDWSLLTNGMTIPVEFQPLMHSLSGNVGLGENRTIQIIIEDELYDATLNNVAFDRNRYANHKDLLQIRYSPNSSIARKLQEIFSDSCAFFSNERQKPENHRKQIKLPKGKDEYIALYATAMPNVFAIECFTSSVVMSVSEALKGVSEYEYEFFEFEPISDAKATIINKPAIQKIRRLDRSIGESLKKLYDYRCQVTGEKIGEIYGENVIEVHHIDYFTKSHNNDSSNIIILSPNFHRIIHKNNPVFNWETLTFDFPNGYHQSLLLNKHLEVCSHSFKL